MHIEEIITLLDDMRRCNLHPKARMAFDYTSELAEFLKNWGYVFCVQDDSFGVQIVVSDPKVALEKAEG